MGLDMYLEKMPRYNNATVNDVSKLEHYFEWKANPKAKRYTLKEWCGVEYKDVPNGKIRKFYEQFFTTKYYYWDTEKEYGHSHIIEEVGYWRKANAIHDWFVKNIQDGIDDCRYHREVTKKDLKKLMDLCHEVLCNPDVAEDRLPTRSGFFFGSTAYGEYYMEDIKNTIDIITQILETTDFEKEMIYYVSSW